MNHNNSHSQSYWFVLREDQSNVIFSSNNFTIQNPQIAGQEARYIVDTGDRQFIQINEAPAAAAVAAPDPTEHSDTEAKQEETFWDRSRIKLLLTLCLENNFRNPTKDKALLEEIAQRVGISADNCCAKYKNLRRTFIRLLRKKRLGKDIKWVHYNICEKVFNECKSLPPSVLEPWDDRRVRTLLDLYIDNLSRFRSDCLQKDVWRDIASQLGTTGYNCYHKFKNLKRAHLKWAQRSRDTGKPAKWPYHRHFERIAREAGPAPPGAWGRAATALLLAAYRHLAHQFRSPRHQKDLWRRVADAVGKSAAHCDKKFRNMKQTYIKLKARADAGRPITNWRYYRDFEAIFEHATFRERNAAAAREDDYVKRLLDFYLHNKERFGDPRIKKKTVWKSLAPEIGLSPEECDRKFRNLKQTYTRLEEKRRLSGGIGKWPYYVYFQRIFDDPQIVVKNIEEGDIDETSLCEQQIAPRQLRDERDHNVERLITAMDEANHIQRERNTILERLLHQMK